MSPISGGGVLSFRCPRSPYASLDDIRLGYPWDAPRPEPLSMADGSPASPELATSVACFWNEQYLFAVFSCHYRNLKIITDPPASPTGRRTPLLWEKSDVVEVFIGAGARATGRYFEIQIAPDGRWTDMRIVKTVNGLIQDPEWSSGVVTKSFVDRTAGEWRAALALPWKSLNPGRALDVSWDCNFYRASGKTHGDELFAWAPTGYGNQCFHRPEKFGRLELQ